MKNLLLMYFLCFSSILSANNFLDDPNFDREGEEWGMFVSSLRRVISIRSNLKPYEEEMRDQVIVDNYFSMIVSNLMFIYANVYKVPKDIPLYFYIEASFGAGPSLDLVIKIVEMPEEELLIEKKVKLTNKDVWSSIISDYPFYKKKDQSFLHLEINFPNQGNTEFHLNYAQVGTDPKSLGGRGHRAKQIK